MRLSSKTLTAVATVGAIGVLAVVAVELDADARSEDPSCKSFPGQVLDKATSLGVKLGILKPRHFDCGICGMG